jgi:hypothetical protein
MKFFADTAYLCVVLPASVRELLQVEGRYYPSDRSGVGSLSLLTCWLEGDHHNA